MRRLGGPAILAAALLAGFAGGLHAEPGLTAISAVIKPVGARASAMGGAFTAVDGGLDSVSYNPAGLSGAAGPALMADYTLGVAGDNFSFAGYAQPLPFGTLALGFTYFDAGSIHLILSDGTDQNVSAERDMAASAGLSVPLAAGVTAGVLLRGFRGELAQQATARGYSADAGLVWHSPIEGLNLGAAIQNAGPDVKYEVQGDPLPLTARFGVSYDLRTSQSSPEAAPHFARFLMTADAVKVKDETASGGAGLEMDMPMGASAGMALRLGYVLGGGPSSITAGVGLRQGRLCLDYALAVENSFDNTHHLSLGWRF